MVANLVDYLVKIVRRHRLRKETLFLSLNMIYRCLEKMPIKDVFNFELLAITCVMIAAKYEEIYPPQTQDYLNISQNRYTREMLFQMEFDVLMKLDFDIENTSPARFLERYLQVINADSKTTAICYYILIMGLMDL
jgi:energy-converting hydrogenase Eha subunit C